MKKKQVKVVNGDWEVTKYKMRQNVNKAVNASKESAKYVLVGFGFGIGLISKKYLFKKVFS